MMHLLPRFKSILHFKSYFSIASGSVDNLHGGLTRKEYDGEPDLSSFSPVKGLLLPLVVLETDILLFL